MAMLELLLSFLACLFTTLNYVQADFNGFQVLSVTAATNIQFQILRNLARNDQFDFWTGPNPQGVTDIMVAPSHKKYLTSVLTANGLKWITKISDVGRIIMDQQNLRQVETKCGSNKMTWTAYHCYKTIVKWLQSLTENKLVKLSIIGQSFEGRNIYQLQISSGLQRSNSKLKPAIFIESHFHAREWITSAVTTWIINEILTNPTKYESLLAKFDLFFVPVVNPDGYEYSRINVSTRLWRKTRSIRPFSLCYGVDANRNFDFKFGGGNSSGDPCSDTYKGPFAFSELETQTIRDAIKALQAERVIHAYISIHSYHQQWMLPWMYTRRIQPNNFGELLKWGEEGVAAIAKVHGKKYEVGQGSYIRDIVGGNAFDWAKHMGIQYAALIEIRDTGDYGYLLPPDQIIPTAQEIWAGVQVIEKTLTWKSL